MLICLFLNPFLLNSSLPDIFLFRLLVFHPLIDEHCSIMMLRNILIMRSQCSDVHAVKSRLFDTILSRYNECVTDFLLGPRRGPFS